MRAKRPFTKAVRDFKKASPWLGPAHQPALVTLFALAEDLDEGDRTPALVAQFGLTYRALAKEAPKAPDADEDGVDELIERGRAA